MAETILQSYLNNQFIRTVDQDNLGKLGKAASEIGAKLVKKKVKIIPYSLSAIDPQIAESDASITEVEKTIISKWPTFKNSVAQTKDKPVTYIRAVILEALSQISKDRNAAALIWYSTRNVFSFYKLPNKEGEIVRDFLLSMGNTIERAGRTNWGIPDKLEFEMVNDSELKIDQVKIDQTKMIDHLMAAAVHNGWSSNAGGGENPHHQAQADWNWPKFFAERAGKGITTEINKTLANNKSQMLETLNWMKLRLNESIEKISNTTIQSAMATSKRSELLWWKESLYSESVNKSYRDLDPFTVAISMAIDLNSKVQPIYPISVDYVLRETLRNVIGEKAGQVETLQSLSRQSSKCNVNKSEIQELALNTQDGRRSLAAAISAVIMNGSENDVFTKTGIDKDSKISLSDLSVWFLHDLQAIKLTKSK